MPRWIARLAIGRAVAHPDHRTVFARFAAVLATRSPRVGLPRVREV